MHYRSIKKKTAAMHNHNHVISMIITFLLFVKLLLLLVYCG